MSDEKVIKEMWPPGRAGEAEDETITAARTKAAVKPSCCMDCPHHQTVADPDKLDWFCDDDVAVLCTISPNTSGGKKWTTDELWPNRAITSSCRPHRQREETARPEWCPLPDSEKVQP